MFETFSVQRLSAGTVYKLWFIGLVASLVPLGLLCGVLAAFGFNVVTWNGQPLHGVEGLVAAPLVCAFFALFMTAFLGTASFLGLWLYSRFRPLQLHARTAG